MIPPEKEFFVLLQVVVSYTLISRDFVRQISLILSKYFLKRSVHYGSLLFFAGVILPCENFSCFSVDNVIENTDVRGGDKLIHMQ